MSFVKIDCGMLDSTVWIDLPLRNVFLTALLMAEPAVYDHPIKQICVDSLSFTGWEAPPGWYGFVPSSGIGIVRRACVDTDAGMQCLHTLGEPESTSRSQAFEGRRMIRVDGGYLILNYDKYRSRDYTAAERMRKYRDRKKRKQIDDTRNASTVTRHVTQAEAEAEADSKVLLGGKIFVDTKSEELKNPSKTENTPLFKNRPVEVEDLPATQLAQKVISELCLGEVGLPQVIGAKIDQLVKFNGMRKSEAVELLVQKGREAIKAGESVNRFWFTDLGENKNGNRKAHESASTRRVRQIRETTAAALRRAGVEIPPVAD